MSVAVDRLTLPGPRAGWWLLGVLAIALPLGAVTLSGGRAAPDAESRLIRYRVRELNMLWRVNSETEKAIESRLREVAGAPVPPPVAASSTDAPERGLGGDTEAARARAARQQARSGLERMAAHHDAELRDLRELFARARAIPVDGRRRSGREAAIAAVIAHCLATGRYALAVDFLGGLAEPSEDLRIAIAAAGPLPAATRLAGMTPAEAADAAASRAFAPGWSRFERERVRARLSALAGHGRRAAALHDRLNSETDTIFAAFNALRLGVALAGLLGVFMLIAAAVRRWAAPAGTSRSGWLRRRFAGLGDERPYHDDPIVPLLGFGGWLLGYALAGAIFAVLPGRRPIGGLAVLFQGAAGIAVTWAIISAFSRTIPPLAAARFLRTSEAMVSPWQASTAALIGFCVLWPAVAIAFVVSALLFGDEAQPHVVAQMMLADPDPFMLAASGVAVIVVAPIGEELFFRGFMHPLLRQRFGATAATLATAALFAAVHMAPAFAAVFFTLGLAFSLLYEWVGSLWASVVLHGLWNACVFTYVVCIAYS